MPSRLARLSNNEEILLVKRRGTRSLRLSVSSSGQARVGLPYFLPYAAGIAFARRHAEWIAKQQLKFQPAQLETGDRIGRMHRLRFIHVPAMGSLSKTLIADNTIVVKSGLPPGNKILHQKALAACEKALKSEAQDFLEPRLKELASRHGYKYSQLRIRKLSSRWGSCSSAGSITLSIFLVQLPQKLIDYVILHELVHARHLNHSPNYWAEMARVLPATSRLRKELKNYSPRVEPAQQ